MFLGLIPTDRNIGQYARQCPNLDWIVVGDGDVMLLWRFACKADMTPFLPTHFVSYFPKDLINSLAEMLRGSFIFSSIPP